MNAYYEQAVACVRGYVLPAQRALYEQYQGDFDRIYTEGMDSDTYMGRVLATPIYTWYCTAPMKNVLDRHYGLNKFYGSAEGSLWAGKKVAIIVTHGYDRAYATDPFAMGVERLCQHSNLSYLGLYSVRDEDDLASFQAEEAVEGAKAFARRLLG